MPAGKPLVSSEEFRSTSRWNAAITTTIAWMTQKRRPTAAPSTAMQKFDEVHDTDSTIHIAR